MPSPRELERHFAAALLGGSDEEILAEILGDGLAPASRLAIYRNHVFATLTEALQAAYPVVVRLVDERFFAYVADRYLRVHPPDGPCLFEYGKTLPDFLATFAACRHLAYLPDVARLEWAIHHARHTGDAVGLDPRWLGAVAPDEIGRLRLTVHPAVSLLESPWPLDRIWRANQPGADAEATVSLDAGRVRLQVCRLDDEVVFRPLAAGTFAFQAGLAGGHSLESAVEAARTVDPTFDLSRALSELLDEGLIVGASVLPPDHGGLECEPRQRPA